MILKMWTKDEKIEKPTPKNSMLCDLDKWINENLKDDVKLRNGEIWFRPLIRLKNSAVQRLYILEDLFYLKEALTKFDKYL
jgi:hypothetical protein